jgi:MerR family mercuric resistance operon transcriptional regulator
MMTIGKLATETGISAETIRYYEKSGFLPEPERLVSGYRIYKKDTVRRLHFIQEAQALGFKLTEISDLMSLTDDPDADCALVNSRAQEKISEIDTKIARLTKMRESLNRLAAYCPADEQPLSACSIINHLYGQEISHE